jgi:hypothetical protein
MPHLHFSVQPMPLNSVSRSPIHPSNAAAAIEQEPVRSGPPSNEVPADPSFRFLDAADIGALRAVDKAHEQMLGHTSFTPDSVAQLERFLQRRPEGRPALVHLDCSLLGAQITDETLALIAEKCPNLQQLGLVDCTRITSAGLRGLWDLRQLAHIDSTGCTGVADFSTLPTEFLLSAVPLLDAADVRSLSQVNSSLQESNLHSAMETFAPTSLKELLAYLNALGAETPGKLTTLDCRGLKSNEITDELLALIAARCPALVSFTAPTGRVDRRDDFLSITDAGMQHLSGLQELEELVMGRCPCIGDGGLESVQSLQKLLGLDITSNKFTEVGFRHVSTHASLERFSSGECRAVGDAGLAHLAALHNLKTLSLGNVHCADPALEHLSSLSRLEVLNLGGITHVTDHGLVHLAKLGDLKTLVLTYSARITDVGLRGLSELRNLRGLRLVAFTGITAGGVAHLDGLRNLDFLDLQGAHMFDKEAVGAVRIHLPSVRTLICPSRGSVTLADQPLTPAGAVAAAEAARERARRE